MSQIGTHLGTKGRQRMNKEFGTILLFVIFVEWEGKKE